MPEPTQPEPQPAAPTPAETPAAAVPAPPTPTPEPDPTPNTPLHEDPAIAAALAGLTEEQRETLLTTGGKNALAARLEEAKAAKAAKADLVQSIGKALGLVVEDKPLDPAELTAQVTAEKAAAQQARVELAIFRAAPTAGGDPAALLDSSSFLRSLEGIDPADQAAVQAAIATAVTNNPRLGVATSPRPPAPIQGQGSGASAPAGLEDQIAAAEKAGDIRTSIALKQQRAASLKK